MSFTESLGLIIESNEISKNMKFLFELAWRGDGKDKKETDDEDYWQ